MSTWNGTYEGVPDGADSPSTLDNVTRDLKSSIEKRMSNEHDTYVADGTAGAEAKDWVHKEGSALAYYEAAAPTNQPNGETLAARDAGRLWVDSDDKSLHVWDGSDFVGIIFPILHVREEQTSGTAGGTFTSGSWVKRTINTSVTNNITGASISSSQITLPAGTYKVQARSPASGVSANKTRLYNSSDTSTIVIGSNAFAGGFSNSFITGTFTLASSKTLELQHRCISTQTTTGLGAANSFGVVEVYSEVFIEKIS